AEEVREVAVDHQRLLGVLVGVGRTEAVLGGLDEARPVEPAGEVELQVVVVGEERGHHFLLRANGRGTNSAALAMRTSSRSKRVRPSGLGSTAAWVTASDAAAVMTK